MKDIPTNLTNPYEPPPADSEKLLRAILDYSPENIILLDRNYKILCFNEVIKNTLLTLTGKELHVGDDYRQYSTSSLKEQFFEAFENAVKGKPTEVEAETIFGDSKIWFRHTLTPVYEPNGALLGVSFVAINIDKRKKAELALKDMAESFEAIIENTSESILLIDKDYKVRQFNRTAKERLLVTMQKELVAGADFRQFLYPGHEEMFYSMFQSALNGESRNMEVQATGKDDIPVWISTKMFPVYDRNKNILGISVLAENIDVRKKAELELKHREENLQKFNHELTLLNTINDTILSTESETELYHKIVTCIVEKGGYKLAWVCHKPAENDAEQKIKALAAFGEINYVDGININLKDPELAKGPTAKTLLTGKTHITNNVTQAAYFKPWLERAQKFGIGASIVLPLNYGDAKNHGVLNIYSENVQAFDTTEVAVLERLANNVSLAIRSISTRREKEEARYFLNERIKELGTIYRVNGILQSDGNNPDEVFTKIVNILPAGWQFPKVCQALIKFDKKTYTTSGYQPSALSQKAEIKTQDGKTGLIEVVYTEQKPAAFEGPFFKEERELINTLAEMVQVHFNKQINQQALLASEANLKSIFDNTDVGHLLLDKKYNIISFNQRFSSGYALVAGIKIAVNKNLPDLLLAERKEFALSNFKKATTDRIPVEYETNYTVNNEIYYFNISIVPVIDDCKVIGLCLSAYDITKRKLLELERQKIISELIQRNRDLEQFAYIVSHNLRAPVANIIGLNEALKEPQSDETKTQLMAGLETSTLRLDQVIRDLNDILQVRSDVSEMKEPVQLHSLAENVKASIAHIIDESKAHIELDFSAAPSVPAIQSYMVSIFYNLISNGIKYAKPGQPPHIKIFSEKNNGHILIHFKDNGTGINLGKYRDQVFGLYKRFHLDIDGKGMGLFMVKTQVEAMGGSIAVESEPNQGTRFILTLNQT